MHLIVRKIWLFYFYKGYVSRCRFKNICCHVLINANPFNLFGPPKKTHIHVFCVLITKLHLPVFLKMGHAWLAAGGNPQISGDAYRWTPVERRSVVGCTGGPARLVVAWRMREMHCLSGAWKTQRRRRALLTLLELFFRSK